MRQQASLAIGIWALRLGLGSAFLSAVADRFGFWGPPGSRYAGWGDWPHFLAYCAQVNSFAPAWLIPPIAWTATAAELGFGIALVGGFFPRIAGFGSAILLSLFAAAMSISFGIKKPLDYSVFADAGGALLLGLLAAHRKGSK